MSAPTDSHLEIAHVLFIDIVAYSKLLIDQQTELVKRLNRLARATEPIPWWVLLRNACCAGTLKARSALGPSALRSRCPKALRGKAAVNPPAR